MDQQDLDRTNRDRPAMNSGRIKSAVRLVNSQTRPAASPQSNAVAGYTDATGIDLYAFVKETLHKNVKDRSLVLQLEGMLRKFIRNENARAYQLPNMTSYDRMIVHRVAAYFGLDHNVTQDGQAVVVTKTDYATEPIIQFKDLIQHDNYTEKARRHSSGRQGMYKLQRMPTQDFPASPVYVDSGDMMRRTRSVDIPPSGIYSPPVACSQFVVNPTAVMRPPRTRNVTISGVPLTELPEFANTLYTSQSSAASDTDVVQDAHAASCSSLPQVYCQQYSPFLYHPNPSSPIYYAPGPGYTPQTYYAPYN